MYMLMKLGKNTSEYKVLSFAVSLQSKGSYEKVDNCAPGEVTITVEIDPSEKASHAVPLFQYASTQMSKSTDISGRIDIYPTDADRGKGSGAILDSVEFGKAWIADLRVNYVNGEKGYDVTFTLAAGEIKPSGITFVNNDRVASVAKRT